MNLTPELTAARVRHLAHRGQLPETARMLAEDAYLDMTDANLRGDIPMAHAKSIQYQYWKRRNVGYADVCNRMGDWLDRRFFEILAPSSYDPSRWTA